MKENTHYTGDKKYIENDIHDMNDFLDIIHILRTHCPWDRVQTFDTIQKTFIDESEEVVKAIDNDDADNLCEELGDILLQVVFLSDMADDKNLFSFEDVVQGVSDKMIRRHPHVFSDSDADDENEVILEWNEIKKRERSIKENRIKRSLKTGS
ncbi:MAG: MazG nucleotide pyrophosphohydrolase domain-containing protein [Erysipelotrichaceae bacterium]|nr:MazG nucleotide pyrophosphohydrolase domain-containing protein [Erysipelotrichaceae bacterium]